MKLYKIRKSGLKYAKQKNYYFIHIIFQKMIYQKPFITEKIHGELNRSGWEWEVLFLLIMCIRRISTDTKDSIQLL
ncbi:hypothetical protein DXA47_05525 [Tyzzerella nexilis]|nr:hypothetical protein DXA47_05525 [[Clostridium] nexile]